MRQIFYERFFLLHWMNFRHLVADLHGGRGQLPVDANPKESLS